MLRALLGVAISTGVAVGVIYAWQVLGHAIFPFPTGAAVTDPINRMAVVDGMSLSAQAWVVAGYPLGVVVGGVLGNLIADARWPAVAAAFVVTSVFFGTLTIAPHPLWMQVAGLLLPLAVGIYVAAYVGRRTLTHPDPPSRRAA